MSEALYLHDSYLRSFEAVVTRSDGTGVVLDRTAFYPTGGGQPSDRGTLHASDGRDWSVAAVEKTPAGILHRLAEALDLPIPGTRLTGTVDWGLRYQHMRYHTLLHVLSGVVYHRFGSGITGGQIYPDRARMDFSLPEFSRELAEDLLAEANRLTAEALPMRVRFISRRELEADPSLVRVARELLPDVDPVRLIVIGDYDVQADGGTHVRSTAELGRARVERLENKGGRNKRLYVALEGGADPSGPTP